MKVMYYLEADEKETPMLIASAISQCHGIHELEEIAKHLLIYCEYKRTTPCGDGGEDTK